LEDGLEVRASRETALAPDFLQGERRNGATMLCDHAVSTWNVRVVFQIPEHGRARPDVAKRAGDVSASRHAPAGDLSQKRVEPRTEVHGHQYRRVDKSFRGTGLCRIP